jgi:acetyl-CoA acetyltransferase
MAILSRVDFELYASFGQHRKELKMREIVVLGLGVTKFGRAEVLGKTARELICEAALMALDDAGVSIKDIEVGFTSRVMSGQGTGEFLLEDIGMTGIIVDNVEKVCASSATGVRHAYWAVGNGMYDMALVAGVERLSRGLAPVGDFDTYQQLMGMGVPPVWYALEEQRYLHDYGATPEQVAQIAVIAHRNGALNPRAHHQKPVTLEEVMNSRMICDPIRLLECAPTSSGASAAVICTKEKARKYTSKPLVTIAACACGTPKYIAGGEALYAGEKMVADNAKKAYEMAGIGPEDIDVTQVHDAMAFGLIAHIEALGYCPKGEGARFVWEGKTEIDGEKPVNTDGGLNSRGHPLAATGIAAMAELVWQLRGEAGPRQVANAKVALQSQTGLGGNIVHIYKK